MTKMNKQDAIDVLISYLVCKIDAFDECDNSIIEDAMETLRDGNDIKVSKESDGE